MDKANMDLGSKINGVLYDTNIITGVIDWIIKGD